MPVQPQYTTSKEVSELFEEMHILAYSLRHEFMLPEHALQVLLKNQSFLSILKAFDSNIDEIQLELNDFLVSLEKVPENIDYTLSFSSQFNEVIEGVIMQLASSGKTEIEIPHLVFQILQLEESMAAYLLNKAIDGDTGMFMSDLVSANESIKENPSIYDGNVESSKNEDSKHGTEWRNYVTCINDNLEGKNPLIGRVNELERTIQVLCRKDKNNPLHIGEPGVGKTALVYGLARLINEGKVPEKLKGARIYSLDVGSLLAGTQYRGDFEKRLKTIMDGVSKEANAVVYIDEIHNLVGAGATGEGSMDASNMLKSYLEGGNVRFIGSTTYDEYKRYFAKSKGLVRRFSSIDIYEPSEEETIDILNQLKGNYEAYHNVVYLPEAIEYAVKGSARHISDRFLPDKAIDLIDEAGAYRQTHPLAVEENYKLVDKALIAAILSKVCKVDAVAITKDSVSSLETLENRISNRIYGQDEAVSKVVEAVMMSKAGLSEKEKPLASLLFVGPTGTGKTELAKTLANELGIGFLRFDMSEYSEKHAVAKLIGSPAGYVGYEDGGILTDAIRKTPDCVLLLDEIEKAHPDIYNILLQVMDYGRLTDNKGNKADFRNVVLIMTSNAGASFASQAKVGFASSVTAGSAMLKQVKKTFQPEFLNRLSSIVVFNEIDQKMAALILAKKLRNLEEKLKSKNVSLKLSDEAKEFLLKEGFSKEYGAREIDRVIDRALKPILMKAILFGHLKDGGVAEITLSSEGIAFSN